MGFAIVLLLLLSAAMVPGCLKIMEHATAGQDPDGLSPGLSQDQSVNPAAGSTRPATPSPLKIREQEIKTTTQPTKIPARSSPDLVTSALPEQTPDLYPVQHAPKINASAEPLRHVRLAEFRQTYVLRGNSTGIIVNATKLDGPLWIWFDVKPLYDCIGDPDSCRGKTGKSISLPYFTITVRDNQTREIIAEDGYGRIYSSQSANRTIKIYREGRYHLTLTGDSVDVTLAVATGTAPVLNETQPAAGSSPATTLPPELLRRIRGGA
jgi:hypothetical protein